ncbi:hypothetical protein FKP32DRAFT_589635 [Trametes sanguinea]|nr:hypothetical protein FKP32DRAFT_589635 [Trametes sanguinea]
MARLPKRQPNYRELTVYRLFKQYKRSFTMSEMIDEVLESAVAGGRKATKQAKTWIMKTLKDLILRRRLVYKRGSSRKLKLSSAFADAVREVRHGPGASRITPLSLRSYKPLSKLKLYQAPTQNELFDINMQLQEECDTVVHQNQLLTHQLEEVTEQRDVVMGECDNLRAKLATVRTAPVQEEGSNGYEEGEVPSNNRGRTTETPPPQQPLEPQRGLQRRPTPPVTPARVVPLVSQFSAGLPTPPDTDRPHRHFMPTRLQSLSYQEPNEGRSDRAAPNANAETGSPAAQTGPFDDPTASTPDDPDATLAEIQRKLAIYASQRAAQGRATHEKMGELKQQVVDLQQTVASYEQKEADWKIKENGYKEREKAYKAAERALMRSLATVESNLKDTHKKLGSVEEELLRCREALQRKRVENGELRLCYDGLNHARMDLLKELQRINDQFGNVLREQAGPLNPSSNPRVMARIREVQQVAAYRRSRSV